MINDWAGQVFHGAQKRQGCSSFRIDPGFLAMGGRPGVPGSWGPGACVGGGWGGENSTSFLLWAGSFAPFGGFVAARRIACFFAGWLICLFWLWF
jgi:hypothetical protein